MVKKVMKRPKSPAHYRRAVILKMKHEGAINAEVANFLEVTTRTVSNILERYRESGLDTALNDEPRVGRPIIVDGNTRAVIVAIVCSEPPDGFDRWSLELLKEQVNDCLEKAISKESIRVVLKEHDLKPWKQKMWCIPELNAEYIERMESILNLYSTPHGERSPLVCIDEKPILLHADKRSPILMEEGKCKKVDYEYKRNGTANAFVSVEPQTGKYGIRITENRSGREFAKFLASVERKYKDHRKISLVMDNLNTHKEKSLTDMYGEKEGKRIWNRFKIYFTPKHGSWLNQAEIAIGLYARQCLGESRIQEIETLRKKSAAWVRYINGRELKIDWTFTSEKAQIKFGYST